MSEKPESNGRVFGETLKYTALVAIVGIAFVLLRKNSSTFRSTISGTVSTESRNTKSQSRLV